jgi:dienelactone hydrolase
MCCPEGSLKFQKETYTHTGTIEKKDDFDIYWKGSGTSCVVVFMDIFGFNSGRHKNIVDELSEEGYLVVMPDLFKGGVFPQGSFEFVSFALKHPWEAPEQKVFFLNRINLRE